MTTLSMADMFCGRGGFSTGAKQALVARGLAWILAAINHWPTAIATHRENFPAASHHLVNVYKLDPLAAVPSGSLDLLMASPTCTFFSRARGGKPSSHQQKYGRMTPTQVVRWVTELDVKILLVENVGEIVRWGPVHDKGVISDRCKETCTLGQPCKRKIGKHFRAWIRKLRAQGFTTEWRILNAADYGEATTRKRFFLIGRRDGKPIRWPEPTHSEDGNQGDMFNKATERWRPALDIIDWDTPSTSIFTRPKPWSAKVLQRIYRGTVLFGWPDQLRDKLARHMAKVGAEIPRVGERRTDCQPFVLSRHNGGAPRGVDKPTPTQCAKHSHLLILPFLTPGFGERKGQLPRVHSILKPLPTLCATGRFNFIDAQGLDIRSRELTPGELAKAMGFPDGATIKGTKTEQIAQIGNAVSVRTAQALVGALLEATA